jgi:hypothetical protein
VVTAASARRTSRAVVALALAGSAATLGFGATTAWADDPTPAATDAGTSGPVAADPPADAPAAPPTIGSWIIGGTELAGGVGNQAAKPVAAKPVAAKPVAKPASKPEAQPIAVRPAAVPAARSTTRSYTRTYTAPATASGPVTTSATSGVPAAAPGGATALPFTGGHVEALLPTGLVLLAGGVALTLAGRPRRTAVLA